MSSKWFNIFSMKTFMLKSSLKKTLFDHLCLYICMKYLSVCLMISLTWAYLCSETSRVSVMLVFPCCTDVFEMSHVLFWIKFYHCHSMLSLLQHYSSINLMQIILLGIQLDSTEVRAQCNFRRMVHIVESFL